MHFLSERDDDFPDSEIAALAHVSPHIGVALQNASMIAERRHDRFEIEQAHRQLANIIRSADVGITGTDSEGTYTHWSPLRNEAKNVVPTGRGSKHLVKTNHNNDFRGNPM